MAQLTEILLSQTHESGAIKLRVAADKVMSARHKFIPHDVTPGLDIVVPALAYDRSRIPILLFTRDEIAAKTEARLVDA